MHGFVDNSGSSKNLLALARDMTPPDGTLLTDDKPREEGVDPAHDECLWYHHGHVALHHAHHAFHGCRIAHGIRSRLAPLLGLCQELALLVCLHHVALTCGKGIRRENIRICPQVDTAHEGSLLPNLGKIAFLRDGLEQRHGVMAKDTC